MMVEAGAKKLVYKVKQWLEKNYAEVRAKDSLKDLQKRLDDLHPSDFEDAMFYLAQLEDVNARLKKVGERYCLDELQLKLEVLKKLPDVSDSSPQEKWASFQSTYRKEDALSDITWSAFKDHLTVEWKVIGAPTNIAGSKKAGKALHTVHNAGSKWFPGRCGHCGRKGHKQADCRDKDKPKSQLQGGKDNKKPSSGGSGSKRDGGSTGGSSDKRRCYKCKKEGHLIKDCPEWNKDSEKDAEKVEIALMVRETPASTMVVNPACAAVCATSFDSSFDRNFHGTRSAVDIGKAGVQPRYFPKCCRASPHTTAECLSVEKFKRDLTEEREPGKPLVMSFSSKPGNTNRKRA